MITMKMKGKGTGNESLSFLVNVCCMTYNHAPYITEAMNGFSIQQTDFPFVCTIIDDTSTDGEQEVIKRYLQEHFDLDDQSVVRNEETDDYVLTFARHKTNHNCFFAVLYLKYNHYSIRKSKDPYVKEWTDQVKYIALCEGDDYWTDPYKLQKQVDVLEAHPDCMLVYTGFETVDTNNQIIERPYYDFIKQHSKSGDVFHLQVMRNYVMTVTTCYRKELIDNKLYTNSPFYYDYALSLCASLIGNVIYLPETTCCYRKTPGSMIVSNKSKLEKELNEVREYYCIAYLKGMGKRRPFLNDLIIKYKILRTYLYEKGKLKELLEVRPSLILLLPIARVMDVLSRIRK